LWSCRGIIAEHGLDGLFMCTMMAGVILVVMGLTGSGTAVRFIPRPVVVGFTNGIALVIASTQLKDLFGIPLPEPIPAELVPRLSRLAENAMEFSWETTALGLCTVVVIMANGARPGRRDLAGDWAAPVSHRRGGGSRGLHPARPRVFAELGQLFAVYIVEFKGRLGTAEVAAEEPWT
jgi:hypothetical protein